MQIRLHKNARTTPAVRQAIQASTLSERALAQKYGVSRTTIRKWKHRSSVEDASHRPHTLKTTLTPAQEAIVVYLRQSLLLPLDDLLAVGVSQSRRLPVRVEPLPAPSWGRVSQSPAPSCGED